MTMIIITTSQHLSFILNESIAYVTVSDCNDHRKMFPTEARETREFENRDFGPA
jgi:hypothetical protein